jgi:RimJ/RimL family protein N-acetyltransferase
MEADLFELFTDRLRLRTPTHNDASVLQEMAADPRVALTTASMPHPYPENGALRFIQHLRTLASDRHRNLAVTIKDTGQFIGMIGYHASGQEAEIRYMISPRYWGLGYATEAARRVVTHILETTDVRAIVATAMAQNKASEAVLRKSGFRKQTERNLHLPVRGGTFLVSFWTLDRGIREQEHE